MERNESSLRVLLDCVTVFNFLFIIVLIIFLLINADTSIAPVIVRCGGV